MNSGRVALSDGPGDASRRRVGQWERRLGLCLLGACLVVGISMRTYLLMVPEVVNVGEPDAYVSDEGVVGLMGKHILERGERPVFFYGQQYLGALEAYLVAVSERFFGYNVVALRLVPYAFSIALIAAVWMAAKVYLGTRGAAIAAALMALPPSYVLAWGLKARGGFVEHMFLSMLLLAIFGNIHLRGKRGAMIPALGFVAGLAAWVNQLVGVFLVVMSVILWRQKCWNRRLSLIVLVGFLLGAMPVVLHCARNPALMPSKLGRKFLLMNRVAIDKRASDQRVVYGALTRVSALKDGPEKLAVVFGLPEKSGPGGKPWLALGLAPLLLFGGAILHFAWQAQRSGWVGSEGTLVMLLAGVIAAGYVSSRYMLVAYPLMAILGAGYVVTSSARHRAPLLGLLVLTVLLNLASVADRVQAAGGDKTAELISTLSSLGCTRGYSAGPMYHIVFQSRESVILSPLQKNRYPAYDEVVGSASEPCYVYRQDQSNKRQHLKLVELLDQAGARHESKAAGLYRILYGFQPPWVLTEALIREARAG